MSNEWIKANERMPDFPDDIETYKPEEGQLFVCQIWDGVPGEFSLGTFGRRDMKAQLHLGGSIKEYIRQQRQEGGIFCL